jgi:hypothetical protein
MRLSISILVALFVTSSFSLAGKVSWDKDGNPILEKPTKPLKGCQKQSLNDLLRDKNSTKCNK